MSQAPGASAVVCFAGVAQLVEHLFCKQVVAGSSPTASSAVGPRVMSSGSDARGFRVLASFSLARPASLTTRETSESCPSGQREQAVNLPAYAYAGSNPALSTSARPGRASVSISCLGELSSPSAEVNSAEPPPQVLGLQPQNSAPVKRGTKRRGFGFSGLGRHCFAGVAQLVERQPSKLNVESSSLFSRSTSCAPRGALVFGSVSHRESTQAQTYGQTRVASSVAGEVEARTGAERTPVREHRTAAETQPPAEIATRRYQSRQRHSTHAHLAQMVEHVLGKDEVTSSILVVGSKP
jgi:hypothetical protein